MIPIYNTYVLTRIVDGSGWKFILLCIPIVSIIYGIMFNIYFARSFGKEIGFALGLIFLPNVFQLILGFGSAEYIGPRGER